MKDRLIRTQGNISRDFAYCKIPIFLERNMMHGRAAFAIMELERGPQEICGRTHLTQVRKERGKWFIVRNT